MIAEEEKHPANLQMQMDNTTKKQPRRRNHTEIEPDQSMNLSFDSQTPTTNATIDDRFADREDIPNPFFSA